MSATFFVRLALVLMFILPGIFALILGATGSSWFFSSEGTSYVRRYLGLSGARVFYVLLGLLLLGCGICGLYDPEQLMPKK